jgi:hypothetical protein
MAAQSSSSSSSGPGTLDPAKQAAFGTAPGVPGPDDDDEEDWAAIEAAAQLEAAEAWRTRRERRQVSAKHVCSLLYVRPDVDRRRTREKISRLAASAMAALAELNRVLPFKRTSALDPAKQAAFGTVCSLLYVRPDVDRRRTREKISRHASRGEGRALALA